jgi:hypothetical protein
MAAIADIYSCRNGYYFMIIRKAVNWSTYLKSVDWLLLIFLLLFFNVKLVVKLVAVLLIYALRFNSQLGFALRRSRLPLFYPAIIIIALINWVAYGLFTNSHYNFALLAGIFGWVFCIVACHQIKLSVERNEPAVVHRTIFLFFIINAAVSLLLYLLLVFKTGAVNLYLYQGDFQKYFIGTGDYITGISFDTSSTNAVINAFGVLYFLTRRQYMPVLACMLALLLTGSNMVNLLLTGILLLTFLFRSNRNQKSMIAVCMLLLLVFLLKVSPQNNRYLAETYQQIFDPARPLASQWVLKKDTLITEKPDSVLTANELRLKKAQLYIDSMRLATAPKQLAVELAKNNIPVTKEGKIEMPAANIHTAQYQHVQSATPIKQKLKELVNADSATFVLAKEPGQVSKWPGKVLAIKQVADYYKAHPFKIITGAGMANFSSKLAFKVSALKIAGGYPQNLAYVNPDFQRNHLDLYLHYFVSYDGKHSVINSPNSVYTQLWAEYGLAGIAAFMLLYLWFFARHLKKLSYALPVLLLMCGVLGMDYWFEQLSIVVLAELLLFLNIKETASSKVHD